VTEPIYFDEPPVAKRLFASTTFAWLWLVLRLYLGWEWFVSGWGKASLRRTST
jgi:thiosulfate dehydrogenase [quinone] large subunit